MYRTYGPMRTDGDESWMNWRCVSDNLGRHLRGGEPVEPLDSPHDCVRGLRRLYERTDYGDAIPIPSGSYRRDQSQNDSAGSINPSARRRLR